MGIFDSVLVALAVMVGLTIVLSVVMLAAGFVARSGPAPHGGIRPDQPQQPQSGTDDARVLVLR